MTILATELVTVQRRNGAYVDAEFVASAPSVFNAILGIQPAPGRVLMQLPERARGREAMIAFASAEQPALRTGGVSGELPDRVVRASGDTYEVHAVADWTPHTAGIPHRQYTLVRVADDET